MDAPNTDAQRMARAIKARNAGRCGCGRPLDNPNNSTNCTRCVERNRDRNAEGMREAREEREAAGLCNCGRRRTKGRKTCARCQARDADRAAARAARVVELRAAGLCTRCATNKAEPGSRQCWPCQEYARDLKKQRAARKAAK